MALPTRVSREQQQQQHVPMIHPIELMHREFDDLLSRFFGGGGVFGPSDTGALPAGMLTAALGATGYGVDVREDDQHIHIDADLPGFKKEDVDISIDGKTLTIAAEHREESSTAPQQQQRPQQPQAAQAGQQQAQQQAQQAGPPAPQQQVTRRTTGQEQKGQYLLRERRYEKFTRSFTLPDDVDTQNVQAKLENGVLEITLNKSQQSKRTKIQVS